MAASLRLIVVISTLVVTFTACTNTDPSKAPDIHTPLGDPVDLSNVSLRVDNARWSRSGGNKLKLSFDYTVENRGSGNIVFPCLYNNTDELIQVNLTDKDGTPLNLGKRLLEGLTLTEPRALRIPIGSVTRAYSVPVVQEFREQGELIDIRVRLHVPSRYDELRSSLEAPIIELAWPEQPPGVNPQTMNLQLPTAKAHSALSGNSN